MQLQPFWLLVALVPQHRHIQKSCCNCLVSAGMLSFSKNCILEREPRTHQVRQQYYKILFVQPYKKPTIQLLTMFREKIISISVRNSISLTFTWFDALWLLSMVLFEGKVYINKPQTRKLLKHNIRAEIGLLQDMLKRTRMFEAFPRYCLSP